MEGDLAAPAPVKTETKDPAAEAVKQAALATASAPAYPTSSKSGPKNWDTMSFDADEPDDDDTQDPNFFFKQLYKGADDDTKRAMMKSYVESNGTALSTNWGEVQKGPVETSPPEGMEARKWGS